MLFCCCVHMLRATRAASLHHGALPCYHITPVQGCIWGGGGGPPRTGIPPPPQSSILLLYTALIIWLHTQVIRRKLLVHYSVIFLFKNFKNFVKLIDVSSGPSIVIRISLAKLPSLILLLSHPWECDCHGQLTDHAPHAVIGYSCCSFIMHNTFTIEEDQNKKKRTQTTIKSN